jgi:hypothetical protein
MVRGVTRTLADEADSIAHDRQPYPALPDELRLQLVTVLLGVAETLRRAGRTAVDDAGIVSSQQALNALHAASKSTAADARALVRSARRAELPARQWLALGSVLTDLRRLVTDLDERIEPIDLPLAAARGRRSAATLTGRRPRRGRPTKG